MNKGEEVRDTEGKRKVEDVTSYTPSDPISKTETLNQSRGSKRSLGAIPTSETDQ